MQSSYTASTVIDAPMDRIFQMLAEPAEHYRFDASGMVGVPETPGWLDTLGQIFVMNMTYRGGDRIEHYQSDNQVTALDEPRLIEWATATHGGSPLGWRWRYELEPIGDATKVTLIYDWSAAPQENIDQFGVPLIDEAGLGSSLELLAKASTDPS